MRVRLLLVILMLALSCPLAQAEGDTIIIGRPTKSVKQEYQRLYPIADMLGKKLGDYGITKGDVRLEGKNSTQATVKLLLDEMIDVIFETPFGALSFIDQGGAVPILTISRGGVFEYNSFIFVRKDSGITSLDDLRGKRIAFEDPGSTSSFHLPVISLKAAGLELTPQEASGADRLSYVFAGSELNVASWTYFGKVDAGALSNLDWDDPTEVPDTFRNDLTVIHQTPFVPRMLVLVRKGLDPGLVTAIQEALMEIASTKDGQAALKHYKINGFRPIADPQTYATQLKETLQ